MGMGIAVSQPTAADSCRVPLTATFYASDLLSVCWLHGREEVQIIGRGCQEVDDTFLLKVVWGLIREVCFRISYKHSAYVGGRDILWRNPVDVPSRSNSSLPLNGGH